MCAACHYPGNGAVPNGGGWCKRVVTGGEIGLQAGRGKHFAKEIPRADFVTGCYCRRIHWLREQRCRLKPTWAPQGVTVPHRCNGEARADAPQGTVGHIESDGGLIQLNGQAAAAQVLFETARGSGRFPEDRGGPAVARGKRRRRGRHLPCRAGQPQPPDRRRAETGLAANVGNDAPQPPHWTAARIGVEGITQHRCGSVRPGYQGSSDRPSQLSSHTPAPGVPVAHAGARQIPATRPDLPRRRFVGMSRYSGRCCLAW